MAEKTSQIIRRPGHAPDSSLLLEEVLRIAPEPCKTYSDFQVHRILTDHPRDYLNYLRAELAAIAAGTARLELPPKQVFTDSNDQGDFRVMPCIVRRAGCARKTVKIVGTNLAQTVVPGQITVGKAFALHAEENFVTHIFDACLLSSARTGACAALAMELLAPCRRSVAVWGAGRVGYYAAFYAASLKGVDRVSLADSIPGRAGQASRLLSRQVPGVEFSAQALEETGTCDVLVLATTSAKPICSPPGPGAGLIVSLGADMDTQHELDPAWAGIADIFVDGEDCLRFGDLAAWLERGLIEQSAPVPMLSLLRHPPASGPGRTRLFVSTGSALLDNLTIGYILDSEPKAQ